MATMEKVGNKSCLLILLSSLLICYCSYASGSQLDTQQLECKRGKSSSAHNCLSGNETSDTRNSNQGSRSVSNKTIHLDKIISINFNNIVKRNLDEEAQSNCTKDDQNSNQYSSSESADLICQPKVGGPPTEHSSEQRVKRIRVFIVPVDGHLGGSSNNLSEVVRDIELGSTNIVQCRFNLVQNQSTNFDLEFKLRWLRSGSSSQGYKNHSIGSDKEPRAESDQITISSEDKRTWTVQRQGGLDLFINDFKLTDEGDYFCQALTLEDKSRGDEGATILDEQRIHLVARSVNSSRRLALEQVDSGNSLNTDTDIYSQENLQRLLPSLHVVPDYSEIALGERAQLACVTRGLDPDPDPGRIQWTFEPFERPGFKWANSRLSVSAGANLLPANCSQLGNILVVWAMSHETVGLFKCSYRLDNFNLTAEAAGELVLRPSADSAPLVFVTPELLRVSANGSATIQCEATGYPAPKIDWYRVDVADSKQFPSATSQSGTLAGESRSIAQLEGIEIKQLNSRDAMAFCEQSGCLAINNNRLQGKGGHVLVTALSTINIQQAHAHHQGQYVCIASNKHGQNQASTLVDVEFKEAPRVRIGEEYKEQTIVLGSAGADDEGAKIQTATFKCSLEAGRPTPRLKWLRATWSSSAKTKSAQGGAKPLIDEERFSKTINSKFGASTADMDIFDLTRVSSATSKVSTRSENDDKTLALHLSTVSVDDEGYYVCLGENELGRHSALARLIVRRPAQVSILQTSPYIFRPNDSFQLDCLASGHPAPLDIEWSRSDRGAFFALISQQSPSAGSTSPTGTPSNGGGGQERAVLRFDRVTDDDAGEYTCAARDPLNSSVILTDTIMLMLEEKDDKNSTIDRWSAHTLSTSQRQLPKLMIRPTKVSAEVGSNVTLDCLAISGLQPTVVEWLAPATISATLANVSIKPYYRSGAPADANSRSLLQLGSKLRIINVNKAHEGVYQCKGRNKIGVENAPALVKVVDRSYSEKELNGAANHVGSSLNASSRHTETKTKIAKLGSNIELRCQVNGMVEQPATSWSRDGQELPASSVQIEHKLWIQNLTKSDEGLYLCSARSSEPNQIVQAKINLLVRASLSWTGDERQFGLDEATYDPASVSARIVASKSNPNLGDSITLECLINFVNRSREENGGANSSLASKLEELERQVVWTNLHSGQSLFQDNVYIQNNLLIIYELRQENSATYRCHYNDLLQHTDYKLLVSGRAAASDSERMSNFLDSADGMEAEQTRAILNINERNLKQVRLIVGARLYLECSTWDEVADAKYFWTRGDGSSSTDGRRRRLVGRESQPLLIESLNTSDADLYQCNRVTTTANDTLETKISDYFLVQVETVAARFVHRPVSFISLPAVKDADHQLELEMKFLPEQADGLLLFSGGSSGTSVNNSLSSPPSNIKRANVNSLNQPDYISLGLVRGQLEFKFELGDGATLLRSAQQLALAQWHRVLIERNRRGATMWIDGQAPVSNSSPGKFFNLNLDSLLYVGGHQVFLTPLSGNNTRRPVYNHNGTSSGGQTSAGLLKRNFYGFAQGFQGCISSLRINGRELELMARNRGVAMGIFECDRAECGRNSCSMPQGSCQVDRSLRNNSAHTATGDRQPTKQRESAPESDLRCICLPPFYGPTCNQTLTSSGARNFVELDASDIRNSSALAADLEVLLPNRSQLIGCDHMFAANQRRCSLNGTSECQPLSSSSFKCHCKLAFGGELCDRPVNFSSNTSAWFNQEAYVHFAFRHSAKQLGPFATLAGGLGPATLNASDVAHLTTFTDQLNVSLRVQTRSSYGLLFYMGPVPESHRSSAGAAGGQRQASKSLLANLLARLSSGAASNKVADYFALSLVDGHAELSFELGSGVMVLRSTRRFNDGLWHQIDAFRSGRQASLLVDGSHRYEAQSPGKLSALNTPPDIYLGGLPTLQSQATNSADSPGPGSNLQLLYSFSGCLAELHINSLGPIALTRSDQLSQLRALRNLLPCKSVEQLPEAAQEQTAKLTTVPPLDAAAAPPAPRPRSTRKPTKAPSSADSDSDDPDELAAAA